MKATDNFHKCFLRSIEDNWQVSSIPSFPGKFCKSIELMKVSIKLVDDIPDCQPTRERLILEILRVEQRAKPTSTKLLYKALPDYARHQFSSPLKLQEFCQEIIALQDEFTFFQIGGYLGLLLGYSLYHFAQTVEAVLANKAKRLKRRITLD